MVPYLGMVSMMIPTRPSPYPNPLECSFIMWIPTGLSHSVLFLALLGTRHRSVGLAKADLVLQDAPDGGLIKSCPEELAAVASCFGDESTIDTCLECAFEADTTLCAELSTLVTENYDMCVQEGKCDVDCEEALADLAQCLLSDVNCDEQDAKPSDFKNLREQNARRRSCKAGGALTLRNCDKCCSNYCISPYRRWKSLKVCWYSELEFELDKSLAAGLWARRDFHDKKLINEVTRSVNVNLQFANAFSATNTQKTTN